MGQICSSIVPGTQVRGVEDAKKELTIKVTQAHRRGAKRACGDECVIAKAFDDSNIGEYYDGVEIGLTVTKIHIAGKIMRYATPKAVAKAIRVFDLTGMWNLPEGEYVFGVLAPTMRIGARPNRHHLHRTGTDGSGRDGNLKAVPTRRISRSIRRAVERPMQVNASAATAFWDEIRKAVFAGGR